MSPICTPPWTNHYFHPHSKGSMWGTPWQSTWLDTHRWCMRLLDILFLFFYFWLCKLEPNARSSLIHMGPTWACFLGSMWSREHEQPSPPPCEVSDVTALKVKSLFFLCILSNLPCELLPWTTAGAFTEIYSVWFSQLNTVHWNIHVLHVPLSVLRPYIATHPIHSCCKTCKSMPVNQSTPVEIH